jgi:hypothetical protein
MRFDDERRRRAALGFNQVPLDKRQPVLGFRLRTQRSAEIHSGDSIIWGFFCSARKSASAD